MSLLEYVVIYYKNGDSSTHSLGCWETLETIYKDGGSGRVKLESSHGGITWTDIEEISAIHLVTEDEISNDAVRKAAIRKVNQEADSDWSER